MKSSARSKPVSIKAAHGTFEQHSMQLAFAGGVTVEQESDVLSGDNLFAFLNQQRPNRLSHLFERRALDSPLIRLVPRLNVGFRDGHDLGGDFLLDQRVAIDSTHLGFASQELAVDDLIDRQLSRFVERLGQPDIAEARRRLHERVGVGLRECDRRAADGGDHLTLSRHAGRRLGRESRRRGDRAGDDHSQPNARGAGADRRHRGYSPPERDYLYCSVKIFISH